MMLLLTERCIAMLQVQHPSLYGHAEPDKQPQEARTPERSQQTAFAASSVRPVATPSLSPQQARENDFSKKKKRSLHDINQASAAHTLEQQRDRSAPAPERLLAQLEAVDQAAQQQASAHPCVGNAVVHHAQASAAPTGPETHTTCRSLPPLLPPLLPADEVCNLSLEWNTLVSCTRQSKNAVQVRIAVLSGMKI